MKLKTIVLILLSVLLAALFLTACGEEKGSENGTRPQSEGVTVTETYALAEDTIIGGDYYETRGPEDMIESDHFGTAAPDISETTISDPSEDTAEVIGPQPPPPATEAPTDASSEPSPPDYGEIETNENGEIELPFVPFDAN